jgi:hypothetical protein
MLRDVHFVRRFVFALIITAAAPSGLARADSGGYADELVGLGGAILVGAFDVGLLTADVVAGARGETLDPGWAIVEVANGAAHLGVGTALLVDGLSSTSDDGASGAGLAIMGVGTWFTLHGVLSANLGSRGPLSARGPGRDRALEWTLLGTGGVLAVGAAIYTGLAIEAGNDLQAAQRSDRIDNEAQARYDARTANAAILAGSAVLMGATGGILWFATRGSGREIAAAPMLLDGGFGLAFAGRW